MIKKLTFLLLLGLGLLSCSDDEEVFDVPVPEEGLTFEPVEGGAIMRYTLPQNSDITALCVRYTDYKGDEVMILGSSFVDSVLLTGFHAPQESVTARITAMDNNDVESAPIERTFSTLASAPYAFSDYATIVSSWGGVRVESNFEGTASGVANIYRVGENPFTQEMDTLFVGRFNIASGEQSNFVSMDSTVTGLSTFVLKTEDNKGYNVRTTLFPEVGQFLITQYPSANLTVSDPGGFSNEAGEDPVIGDYSYCGIEYLTDGDKTGKRSVESGSAFNLYSYYTKPNACGSYVQVELDEPRVIASVRLYGFFRNMNWYYDQYDPFDYNYEDRLPNHVRIWATNDEALAASTDAIGSGWQEGWTQVGEFFQQKNGNGDYWPQHSSINTDNPEDYDALTPYYAEVVCDVVEAEYKYIRVEAVDHFTTYTWMGDNTSDYITYHELEVYVQKD